MDYIWWRYIIKLKILQIYYKLQKYIVICNFLLQNNLRIKTKGKMSNEGKQRYNASCIDNNNSGDANTSGSKCKYIN